MWYQSKFVPRFLIQILISTPKRRPYLRPSFVIGLHRNSLHLSPPATLNNFLVTVSLYPVDGSSCMLPSWWCEYNINTEF